MTLEGFSETTFTYDDVTRRVYRRGAGPAVVVMHEIPGITPEVTRFSARVADAGFSVFMPHLFGAVGRPFSASYAASEVAKACVSRDFRLLAGRQASPLTEWLRALARHAHEEIGGRGVGAIGMCITGNFALALAMDAAVVAPVLSQPSLPPPFTRQMKRALHISDDQLVTLRTRAQQGLKVLGLRFTGDPACPGERFERLRDELGDGFEGIEIDSSPGNAHRVGPKAHSVVTKDLVDAEGHPTRAALDRVIAFFGENLR